MNSLEQWTKETLARGIYPGNMAWVFGKMKFLANFYGGKRLVVNLKIEYKEQGFQAMFRVWLALRLLRLNLLNNSVIKFAEWMYRLPSYLKPKWYLNMDGHNIFMNERDGSMVSILKDYIAVKKNFGLWEPETTKIVKDNVKLGDVCLDVGASIGYFTLLFSRLVGKNGKVLSFEPTTNQIPYIKENIRKNGYSDIAEVFNVGAWDKSDQVMLPLNAGVKYDSKCVAIDDILESRGIKKVDFIKIDVDGPEPKVLKGLIRTIERNPNLKMVIEFYPKYIKDAGCDPAEFQIIIDKYFTHKLIPGDYSEGCWNLYCERRI